MGGKEERDGGEKCWMESFRLVSLLFRVGWWVSGMWVSELELKPTPQLRVGQFVFLRVSNDKYFCSHMYLSWDKINAEAG